MRQSWQEEQWRPLNVALHWLYTVLPALPLPIHTVPVDNTETAQFVIFHISHCWGGYGWRKRELSLSLSINYYILYIYVIIWKNNHDIHIDWHCDWLTVVLKKHSQHLGTFKNRTLCSLSSIHFKEKDLQVTQMKSKCTQLKCTYDGQSLTKRLHNLSWNWKTICIVLALCVCSLIW